MPNDALLSGNNDDFSKELAAMVDARALEDIKKMVLVFCNAKNDIVSTIAHFSEPVRKKSGIDADLEALSSDLETINKRLIDGRITHAQTWNQLKIYLLRIKQLLNRCSDTLESLHEKPSRIRSTLFEDPSKKV